MLRLKRNQLKAWELFADETAKGLLEAGKEFIIMLTKTIYDI